MSVNRVRLNECPKLPKSEKNEDKVETLVTKLNENDAIKEVLEQKYYEQVAVLPIKWKKPGRHYLTQQESREHLQQLLDIKKELSDISDIFRARFNYHVEEIFEISDEPQGVRKELRRRVDDLIDTYGESDSLIIIVYGGHGVNTRTSKEYWRTKYESDNVWAASTNADGGRVNWSRIQERLEDADCDTLMIIDCCYSGSAVTRGVPNTTNEVLAAVGPDAPSYFGTHAYSRAIKSKLSDMKIPFTAQQLHEALLDESRQKPISQHADTPLAIPDHGFAGESRKRSIHFKELPRNGEHTISENMLQLQLSTPSRRLTMSIEVELDTLDDIVESADEWEEWFIKRNPPTNVLNVRFYIRQGLLLKIKREKINRKNKQLSREKQQLIREKQRLSRSCENRGPLRIFVVPEDVTFEE
ncbi:MAG: hypothetical protein Q9165_003815 [Trypethelium subeluteriae]